MTAVDLDRGLVEDAAEFVTATLRAGVAPARRRVAADLVLDAVGNMVLGAGRPVAAVVHDVARGWGADGPCTVVGRPGGLPAPSAAFVNGTLAHCTDFDDTHLPSLLHPGASVIPAVLAATEALGSDGPSVIDAVAIGIELCVRLGMAGYDEERGNSIFFDRGQHATSSCGAIASALAVAGVSREASSVVASAGAIAASMSSGLIEANRSGGSVKQIHTGWAAHGGVIAAELALAGLTGPPTVLEGRFGFFRALCGRRARPSVVTDGLGERWYLDEVRIKPYPCNYFTHSIVDGALELRRRGVRPEEVRAVEIGVAEPALRTIAEPAAAKAAPGDGYAAAFSGPYTFAAALAGGGGLGVHLADFSDAAVRRPHVRALAALVTCGPDPDCTAAFPRRLGARIRVRLADGRAEEVVSDGARGGDPRGVTPEEIVDKYLANTVALGTAAEVVREEVRHLPRGGSARAALAPLRGPLPDPVGS